MLAVIPTRAFFVMAPTPTSRILSRQIPLPSKLYPVYWPSNLYQARYGSSLVLLGWGKKTLIHYPLIIADDVRYKKNRHLRL